MQNNIKYSDIADIVENLVKLKASSYRFDHFDTDDVAQEIRIICLKALNHFEVDKIDKDKWANFFGRCVDNGLKNLKRDNYVRFTPSCTGECNLLHGDEFINSELDGICKKWVKFKINLKKKLNIKHPVKSDAVLQKIPNKNFEAEIDNKEYIQYVLAPLDDKLKKKITDILAGNKRGLSSQDIKKINEILGGVLED